jgi:SAM-dependent methyltransferase
MSPIRSVSCRGIDGIGYEPGVRAMGLYERFLLPKVVNFACSMKPNMRQRAKVVPLASGSVLEVGFGSGLNLPFYDRSKVQRVWALDPSAGMWAIAEERVRGAGFPVEFLKAEAEQIPLANERADTVLVTYTLCTLPDVRRALGEMARVLKRGGELVFCEHGAAPDESVRRWQNRVNPVWKSLAGGCNLNRPIPSLIEEAGFRVRDLSSMYIPGWKPASFNYWGRALAA